MDWFKKQKWSNWIIGILFVLNILTLGSLWLMTLEKSSENHRPPGNELGRERMVMELLSKELDLSGSQVQQLRAMRRNHFEGFEDVGRRMMQLRNGIMEALFADPPDTVHIQHLSQEIGQLHAHRELINAEHLGQLRDICTPEQRKKFESLVQEIMPAGNRGRGREWYEGRAGQPHFQRNAAERQHRQQPGGLFP